MPIEVRYGDPDLGRRVRSLWRELFALSEPEAVEILAGRSVEVTLRPARETTTGFIGRNPVFDSPGLRVWQTEPGFHLESGESSLDTAPGRVDVALAGGFWSESLRDQREFFLVAMLMALRSHGLYGLHANALVLANTRALLVGDSGCGKTTTTLALIRAGWSYLSDDALMIRAVDGGAEVMAFRRGFSSTDLTRNAFPELRPSGGVWREIGDSKWLADLDTQYQGRFVDRCTPNLIVFPEIVPAAQSRLDPVDQTEGFTRLLRQSSGILTDPASVNTQFGLLKSLVEQVTCWRLLAGTDVYERPEAISSLLASAGGQRRNE
ncbi:MAG: hypothetical protein WD208_11430 [Dehalococcoidia bacterium]